MKKYLANEVDTDFDGFISDNEFLTLASLVYGTSPTDSQVQELRENCTMNRTFSMTRHQRTSYADAVVDETVTVQALPTLQVRVDEPLFRKSIFIFAGYIELQLSC